MEGMRVNLKQLGKIPNCGDHYRKPLLKVLAFGALLLGKIIPITAN